LQLQADFDKGVHEQRQRFQRIQGQRNERRTGNTISAGQAADAAIGAAHHAAHEGKFEGPVISGAGAFPALVQSTLTRDRFRTS
jgi:hypothetical protein